MLINAVFSGKIIASQLVLENTMKYKIGQKIKDGAGNQYEIVDHKTEQPKWYPEDWLQNTNGQVYLCEKENGRTMWIDELSIDELCEMIS